VRIPSVNTSGAASDTVIYIHYGNSIVTTPTENPTGVWDASYAAVWHEHDDFLDSTSNNNDGTNFGSANATGQVADGQSFDGTDDYIFVGSGASIDDVFAGGGTAEAWINPAGWGESGYGRVFNKGHDGGWSFFVDDTDGNDSLSFLHGTSLGRGHWITDDFTINLSAWQHVAVTYDKGSTANDPTLYIDGVSVNVTEFNTPTGTLDSDAVRNMLIGNRPATDRTFDGILDELRVSDTARSACWIDANYDNQNDPGDIGTPGFYTVGVAAAAVELISFTAVGLDGAVELA